MDKLDINGLSVYLGQVMAQFVNFILD